MWLIVPLSTLPPSQSVTDSEHIIKSLTSHSLPVFHPVSIDKWMQDTVMMLVEPTVMLATVWWRRIGTRWPRFTTLSCNHNNMSY